MTPSPPSRTFTGSHPIFRRSSPRRPRSRHRSRIPDSSVWSPRPAGASSAATFSTIRGVGPITVDPDAQDSRVGTALMHAMLDRSVQQFAAGVRLMQSAYHNRSMSLYAKLGFDVHASFATMQGEPLGLQLPGYTVRLATQADAAACDALRVRVHGHDRAGEVRDAVAHGTARVVERHGRITGYTIGMAFIAHLIAETNDDLAALIACRDCGSVRQGAAGRRWRRVGGSVGGFRGDRGPAGRRGGRCPCGYRLPHAGSTGLGSDVLSQGPVPCGRVRGCVDAGTASGG
jgi:Acetyltransferase (GNAT) family